jgi:hypothetical protein
MQCLLEHTEKPDPDCNDIHAGKGHHVDCKGMLARKRLIVTLQRCAHTSGSNGDTTSSWLSRTDTDPTLLRDILSP